MSPLGTFKAGVRQKPWSSKDIPGFSGKLMPEFDKRRSIKDMFNNSGRKAAESTKHSSGSIDASTDLQKASANLPECDTRQPSHSSHSHKSTASPSKSLFATKREASDSIAPTSSKKHKQGSHVPGSLPESKGQQSLKGFFVPKSKSANRDVSSSVAGSSKTAGEGSDGHDAAKTVVLNFEQGDEKSMREETQASECTPACM